jgi:hypothetical protein
MVVPSVFNATISSAIIIIKVTNATEEIGMLLHLLFPFPVEVTLFDSRSLKPNKERVLLEPRAIDSREEHLSASIGGCPCESVSFCGCHNDSIIGCPCACWVDLYNA